jgi:hypothetical protein
MDLHTTYKEHADASFRRWKAFWDHDVADRIPLVIHFQQETDEERPDTIQEDMLQAETFDQQFDLEYVMQRASRAERRFAERSAFPDDMLPQIAAPGGLAVTGWLFGCQVAVKAGIPWVEPILENVEDWRNIIDKEDVRRRFERVLRIDEYLSERSDGRYAVSAGALDGPADMAVRLMGEEKLALALYENPDQVEELFAVCTRLWRDLVCEKLQTIPTYGGGTATGWSYWLPGKGIALQEDFGQMVSPTHFRERILHYDAQLTETVDHIWFHVHSGAPHMAKEVAKMGAFDVVQICNDHPAGPTIGEMLPTLQYLQAQGPLILRKFTLDQLDSVIGHLSPQGLAIDIQCYDSTATEDIQRAQMSREEAMNTIAWAREWCQVARN